MKKAKTNKAVSTITSEMLMLTIVVILTTAVVVSIQSNISYYITNKEVATITLWSTTKNGWMNLTVIHAGGDAVTISGRICIEHENGTSNNPKAYLIHGDKTIPIIKGQFEITSFKFGEHLQVNINLTETTKGVIHCILYSKTQVLAEVTQKIETNC